MSKQDLFVPADKNSVEQHEWLICLNAVEQRLVKISCFVWFDLDSKCDAFFAYVHLD